MRILFLSQIVPYPPHGGVLQRGYNVLRQLGQRAAVDLLAFVHPDALPNQDSLAQSRVELGKFCSSLRYFPLWVKRSPIHMAVAVAAGTVSSTPFSMIAHRSREYQAQVTAALTGSTFDVVHVDTIALTQFVDVARPPKAATVLTHHNIESMLLERRAQVEPRRLARRFLQREGAKLAAAEAAVAPRFDLNIVMSAADRDALMSRAPGVRASVVSNGVDTDYFTPAPERETPALIYGGGMNMFANRDAVLYFLTAIWPRIRSKRPDVKFFAVGQDPPRELLAVAERDPQVVVTGYVADIREYIWKAAVYVVPLRVGGGTRLKVLDAMAMGKAMVSTTIGCEGIEVVPGTHLQIADTPEAFADETLALLSNADRRRTVGSAARSLVERKYSWPVIGDHLYAAYDEAIEAARRRA